ncbi:hyaluronan mediated motility receptor [Lampris incognitus]|uniref:hyaluronan mediated motility receptor n=1 Tax=Lampris incognitus TaxID=2546036 RepID=UPI0024B4FB6C|nr:hyaluronan mediated motility receptor [Lampris incognitus]
MSFSKAPLKRFNDYVGCAPPPGSYEIKPGEMKGATSFQKSERFKSAQAVPPPSPSRSVLISNVRKTSFDDIADGSSVKREKTGIVMEMKQQRLLEKEIRSLVQQRGEQDKRLLALEEELKKLDAKLLVAVREKIGLSASVTTLDRQLSELKKINELLKNKVSADTTKKKICSLTMELMEARNQLDVKNKELSFLHINSEGQLKVLETDLKAAKATVTSLKDRNKDLEEMYQVTKTQNEELVLQINELHVVIRELREEIKVLQHYLDTANDEIQDLRLKLQEKTKFEHTVADSQQEKVSQQEKEMQQFLAELEHSQDVLRQKDEQSEKYQQELQASHKALQEMENRLENCELELKSTLKTLSEREEQIKQSSQDVQDSQCTVHQQEVELARLRGVLRRTEQELDERVAQLEERCLIVEEERRKTQEEGCRRVEEFKKELNSLENVKREEKKKHIQLQQEHETLTEELQKEKALVDSMSVLLKQEREEYEERLSQLKDEMEEVLGELAAMEEQEQKKQEPEVKSQEALQCLQQENEALMEKLSEARILLDSKGNEVAAVGNHLATIRKLEEHANSLTKIGDLATELESTQHALRVAEGRGSETEAEVENMIQRVKEEMEQVIQQKEEEMKGLKEHQERLIAAQQAQEKTREEHSRMLLELQTSLAQKDEEIKALEGSCMATIKQLQEEVKLYRQEKDEALEKLEEHGGQIFSQHKKEEAQRLLDKAREEEQETLKQLPQERKASQQGRAEVLRLQTHVEKTEGEMKTLISQVVLTNQDKLTLQNPIKTAEDNRRLQSELKRIEQQHVHLQTQVELLEGERMVLKREIEEQKHDRKALQEQVDVLAQEKVTLQWEMEEQRQELQRRLMEAKEKSISGSETEHWKRQYEELFAKVKPFQEQLNGFAAEREALLSENGANKEELNKLVDAYTSLLGHQNMKQKIKHVVKLKNENIALKQELVKLRSQLTHQKKDIEQLKLKFPGAPRHRFDLSKAFQHDCKENRQPQSPAVLQEGNH